MIRDQSDEEGADQHAAHVQRVVERTPEVAVAGEPEVRHQGRSDNAIKQKRSTVQIKPCRKSSQKVPKRFFPNQSKCLSNSSG